MKDLHVGDLILAQIGDEITECHIVAWSPSQKYIKVDDGDLYWIRLLDYLETLEAAEK